MFDTVNLRLYKENLPPDHINYTIKHLYGIRETSNHESGTTVFIGYLDTLKVIISPHTVQIKDSSLCKYQLGSNLMGLQRNDIQSVIEKISDELHLPFGDAIVTRLDIASNLVMKEPEKIYFDLMGESTYYTRLEQEKSLYYNKHNEQKVFYNKLDQMKANQESIPGHYQNHHVLRYEVRYISRMPAHFKKDQVFARDLYQEKFYIQCIDQWSKEYFDIKKYNQFSNIMIPTGSTKEFLERLALEGLKSFGNSKTMNLIKAWQDNDHISAKQAYHLRKKVEGLLMMDDGQELNEFIRELDQKILDVADYYK